MTRIETDQRHRSALLRHFVKVLSVDAFVKTTGVLLLPLYLALMTQSEYATFNYLTAVIAVLSQVCTFGLYVPLSKIFHDIGELERSSLLSTIGVLLIGLLSLALLPTYALGWDRTLIRFLFSGTIDYERYRYLIPVGVVLAVCSQMMLSYFLTRQQIKSVQRYNILRLTLGTILVIGSLYYITGDKAAVRLIAYLAAESIAFGMFSIAYLRAMRGALSVSFARKSLAIGLPIMGSAVLGIAINFGDKFFLEKFCSLPEMSVYFLGLTAASVISAVFAAFQNVWLPEFLKEKDLATNLTRTWGALRILSLAFGGLALLIWLGVAVALHLNVINPVYTPVLKTLPLLLLASICSSLVGILSVYTVYWEMTYITILTGVVITMISIPLNYFSARYYGINGIAAASVVVNLLYGALYYGFIRHRARELARQAD